MICGLCPTMKKFSLANRMERPIIHIDETKCDGCGQCVLACAEGALAIIDGKARLVSETFCDGLGACLHCPQDALALVTREAQAFDEEAVKSVQQLHTATAVAGRGHCPGSIARVMGQGGGLGKRSPLSSWPIQLRLLPASAPFLKNAKILFAAYCAGFACTNLHEEWLVDRTLIIACPKLEPKADLLGKLAAILGTGRPVSIDILRMSVPCCGGLEHLVNEAMSQSGVSMPMHVHTVAVP